MKEDKIARHIETIEKQCERYLWSVFLTIGIKDFVETKKNLCLEFISSEKKMKDPKTGKLIGTPDIVLQYEHISEGILIEMKISVPISKINFDYFLTETIEQLQKYDKDLTGWFTESGRIDNHHIILLIDHEDSKKTRKAIRDFITNNDIEFKHVLSFWEWTYEPSVKYSKKDVITVRDLDDGKIGNKLGNYLEEKDLYVEVDKINKTYDLKKYIFIRKKPQHPFYVIDILISIIFPALGFDEKGNLTVTIDEIMTLSGKYFPSWLPESGTNSQLKRSWVKESLSIMEEINLAKREGKKYNIRLPREKNINNYLLKKLAKRDIDKKQYYKQELEKDEKMRTIYDFESI